MHKEKLWNCFLAMTGSDPLRKLPFFLSPSDATMMASWPMLRAGRKILVCKQQTWRSLLNVITYPRSSDAASSFFVLSHSQNPIHVLTQQIYLCILLPIYSSSCSLRWSRCLIQELPIASEVTNPRHHIQLDFSVLLLAWTALNQCCL